MNSHPAPTKLQNTIFAWIIAWPVIAVFADGWHHHHLGEGGEALFNPFHIFLYTGVFCGGLFLLIIAALNLSRGYSWRNSLPKMFVPAVWGVILFIIGAAADLTWHHIFGFEESIDALVSPPHMVLAAGGLLAISVLMRTIWHKDRQHIAGSQVPVLGFLYFLLIIEFFFQFWHPYYLRWLTVGTPVTHGISYEQAGALTGTFIRTILFCGMLFTTIKYFKFPKGSLFFILLIEAVAIGYMGGQFQYIISAVIAGLLTEFIYQTFYSELNDHGKLRLFGFLVPAAFYAPYIFVSLAYDSTWWSIHMIFGVIFANAVIGWLLTYLIKPPKQHDLERLPI